MRAKGLKMFCDKSLHQLVALLENSFFPGVGILNVFMQNVEK